LASQLLNAGCAEDLKFFDLKKTSVKVADPEGEAEVKAACCTPLADAKCSDWAAVLGSCPSGETFEGTNSAPPDGSDGKTLSKSKYQEMCCVGVPQTCSDFSVAWAVTQLLGSGCAADTKFFDLKKTGVEVAAPAGDGEVKAACCTPFADAKCSDWAAVLGSCPSGKTFQGTTSAPPDGSNGKTLSQSKYREMCCVEVPQTCSDFSVAWAVTQLLGLGCAADTKFFDLKKTGVEVAAPAGDDEVKSACCTPFADAKCSDWAAVLGSCPSGKTFEGTTSAPPDGSDGKTLSKSKYQEMCCVGVPQTCSDFSVAWAVTQLLGLGCAADTKFFDLKKTGVEVAAPAGDDEVKSACCTPFADAKCSDWSALKSCSTGSFIVSTNSAPADGSDGKVLTQAKFQELCCHTPMKCADYRDDSDVSSSVSQATASLVVAFSAIIAMVAA